MSEVIVSATDLEKLFPVRMGFFGTLFSKKQLFVHAVDGISFEIKRGEVFGLVGESGSGKTTTGRLLLRLIEPTGGKVVFKGKEITHAPEAHLKHLRRLMQIVFQDPYESLNPRMTISDILAEPLRVQGLSSEVDVEKRVKEILTDVELIPPEEFLFRFPHELSGGQRQRVATARAFVLNPEFIVADEPVSMLDVSTRAEVLDLMLALVEKFRASFLYITHDLALARHICDKVAVMYLGKIMESGVTDNIIYEPLHPYTRALISAVPVPDPTSRRIEVIVKGEIPSPVNPPPGCRFHTRCPIAIDVCRKDEPKLVDYGDGHCAACHLVGKPVWEKFVREAR